MPGPGPVASFVPARPVRLLVLAHGFPWPDGSRSDSDLSKYARAAIERWRTFAQAHHAVVLAPTFGGHEFAGYREMTGRSINPDAFVNALVENVGAAHIPRFSGRFSLHGHSAGAQFAGRYLVTHPERLEEVILSAPSTYPFPDPATPWPHGMAPAGRQALGRSRAGGRTRDQSGRLFTPRSAGWLAAASEVFVNVLVGSRDTGPRPAAPGQQGSTRMERANAWVDSMRHHAEANHRTSKVQLVVADELGHDEAAMAAPAQRILAQRWGPPAPAGPAQPGALSR